MDRNNLAPYLPFAGNDLPAGYSDPESGRRFLDLMYETTGVPTVMRGGNRMMQGYEAGDPWQLAGGAGEIALGAMPGAAAARPVMPAGRAILSGLLAPATVVGGAVAAGEAYAQDQVKASKAAGNENAGSGFWQQLSELMGGVRKPPMNRDEFMSQKVGKPKSEADFVREEQDKARAAKGFARLDQWDQRKALKDAEARGRVLSKSEEASRGRNIKETEGQYDAYLKDQDRIARQPFKERFPDLAARLPMAGLAASAAIPAAFGAVKNAQSWLPMSNASRVNRSAANAEAAALNPNATEVQRGLAGNQLAEHVAAADGLGGKAARYGGPAATVGAGAGVGAELNMFPYQFDANVLPTTTDQDRAVQQQAQRDAFDPVLWATKALMNVPTAASGYKFGGVVPQNTPNLPNARGTLTTMQQQNSGGPVGPRLPPTSPGAGGGQPAAVGGPGGAAQIPGQTTQLPPVQPNLPAGAGYDPAIHGPVSRQHLNEMLTYRHPTRQAMEGQPDPVNALIAGLQNRYQGHGLPAVSQADLATRAQGTQAAATDIARILSLTNSGITEPRLRQYVLDAISGRPGMLAVPLAAGAAAGSYQDQPNALAPYLPY